MAQTMCGSPLYMAPEVRPLLTMALHTMALLTLALHGTRGAALLPSYHPCRRHLVITPCYCCAPRCCAVSRTMRAPSSGQSAS
eukprot:scaffold54806_cov30-Phaeocystis_antarctica.AAC.1